MYHNAAYCYDFAAFVEKYGPLLCVSLPDGSPPVAPLSGIRVDWVFQGFQHNPEKHYRARLLELENAADLELARQFWDRARYWAADNDKKMPLRLYPYPIEA